MSRVTAELVRARMVEAREYEAGKRLDWPEVSAAIGTAAGKGLGQTVFTAPAGVSLKATAVAAALIEKLTATGFRCEWKERRDPGDVLGHDLVVSWEGGSLDA